MASSNRRLHPSRLISFLTSGLYILSLYSSDPANASNLIPDNQSSQSTQGTEDAKSATPKAKAHPGAKPPTSKKKGLKTNAPDLTGNWYFEIDHNQHRGYIRLQQSGTLITGVWHTTSKQEEDTPVVGQIYGNRVVMRRSKVWGSHDQDFDLEILSNGIQLYGYGEGFFLHHTDLNMRRVSEPQ